MVLIYKSAVGVSHPGWLLIHELAHVGVSVFGIVMAVALVGRGRHTLRCALIFLDYFAFWFVPPGVAVSTTSDIRGWSTSAAFL